MKPLTERDRVEGRWLLGAALIATAALAPIFAVWTHAGLPWYFGFLGGPILGFQAGIVTLPVARRLHPLPKCASCGRLLP